MFLKKIMLLMITVLLSLSLFPEKNATANQLTGKSISPVLFESFDIDLGDFDLTNLTALSQKLLIKFIDLDEAINFLGLEKNENYNFKYSYLNEDDNISIIELDFSLDSKGLIDSFKINSVEESATNSLTVASNSTISIPIPLVNFALSKNSLAVASNFDDRRNINKTSESKFQQVKGSKKKNPIKKKKKKIKTTTVPKKTNGGKVKGDFISEHSYKKHGYKGSTKKSTASATQYGKDIDVKKLRELTMKHPEQAWSARSKDRKTGKLGPWRTFYRKEFDSNISTSDTKTTHHRVIINKSDSSKNTQFPLYFNPK